MGSCIRYIFEELKKREAMLENLNWTLDSF
jgi:hypothetical protein